MQYFLSQKIYGEEEDSIFGTIANINALKDKCGVCKKDGVWDCSDSMKQDANAVCNAYMVQESNFGGANYNDTEHVVINTPILCVLTKSALQAPGTVV